MTLRAQLLPAIIALLLGPSLAHAQEATWQEAYKDQDRTVFIRVDSVKATKVGVTAWMKLVFVNPLPVPEFKTQAHMMQEKAEYSKTHKWSRRVLMYDANGKQLVDHTNPTNNPGAELIPDSAEENIAKQVWGLLKKGGATKRKTK